TSEQDAILDSLITSSPGNPRFPVDSSFFFSSRRRHTSYWHDWSSDVCSSDLVGNKHKFGRAVFENVLAVTSCASVVRCDEDGHLRQFASESLMCQQFFPAGCFKVSRDNN